MTPRTTTDSVRVAAADSAAAVALQRHATERDALQREVEQAQTRRDTVLVEIERAENVDTLRALVVELTESHEQETTALRSALAEADAVIRAQTAQIAARDALVLDLRASLASAIDASQARSQARGGFFSKIADRALWVAGGVAIGAVAVAAAGG